MPEIGLLFILNAIFIIHAARSGRFWPWAYVILFLPGIGVAAYVVMEVLPEYRYSPTARKAQAQLGRTIDPRKRYRALQAELEIADTLGNRLALAQECLQLGRFEEAATLFKAIRHSPQGDEPIYFLGQAQAEFGSAQPDATLATLDALKQHWPDYHSQEGHLLYARALEAVGRDAEALHEYEDLSRYFAGQEVPVRKLLLLDKMGHPGDAEAIAADVMRYYKRAPKFTRHQQAEWFSAAKAYLKQRGAAQTAGTTSGAGSGVGSAS